MKIRNKRIVLLLVCLCLVVLSCCACSANETGAIETLIGVIAGIVGIATTAADVLLPTEITVITSASTLVQNGLKTLLTLVQNYKSNPTDTALQQVQAAFNDLQSNMTALESAAQVKDPATAAKLGAVVTASSQTLAVIEAALVGNHPASVAAAQSQS